MRPVGSEARRHGVDNGFPGHALPASCADDDAGPARVESPVGNERAEGEALADIPFMLRMLNLAALDARMTRTPNFGAFNPKGAAVPAGA